MDKRTSVRAETARRISSIAADWPNPDFKTTDLLLRAAQWSRDPARNVIPMTLKTAEKYLGKRDPQLRHTIQQREQQERDRQNILNHRFIAYSKATSVYLAHASDADTARQLARMYLPKDGAFEVADWAEHIIATKDCGDDGMRMWNSHAKIWN